MTMNNTTDSVVSIGIDAAVVADHQVAIRGPGVRDDFGVSPTVAGMSKLTERLRPHAGALVVVEPTAGTWLPLTMAVTDAGCRIGFVQSRDSAKLRSAIAGRNKTDAIDADMLARCEQVLGVYDAPIPLVGQVGLRRALTRRHRMVVDAHRAECRLWSLLIWVMPDVWRAAGGHTIIQPLLSKWPDLRALGRARVDSITHIVAAHSRDRDPPKRAERIRDAAQGWSEFWDGRLDLDAITWEITELCDDIALADQRRDATTDHALQCWKQQWANDVLLSVLGVGPICASTTRAWWGQGTHLRSAKAAGAFIGLNPSNWESGLSASPSRSITKEGPAAMRLAYYQAANVARRRDPQLAFHYRKLMSNAVTPTSKRTALLPASSPRAPGLSSRPASPTNHAISTAIPSTRPPLSNSPNHSPFPASVAVATARPTPGAVDSPPEPTHRRPATPNKTSTPNPPTGPPQARIPPRPRCVRTRHLTTIRKSGQR